ncbi:MAG: hypothetical protein RL033_6725 [Pseudomonadota bacterium]
MIQQPDHTPATQQPTTPQPRRARTRRGRLLLGAALAMGLTTACKEGAVPAQAPGGAAAGAVFLDLNRSFEERARDLVSHMTTTEKAQQLMDEAPAIERLGVPAYGWWNEALHGVARAGTATVFPQAIALAATFDDALLLQVASVISTEARAKHHEAVRKGERERYQGLTFFSPNINIFRDPRWGRGHETYGEDPYLTGQLALAFIHGLQGDDPKYWKTMATAKHYAVHSGPESQRHHFNAEVSPHDLADTYLPQFELAVKEGKVGSVMAAYNAVGGKACASNELLLQNILRRDWGFQGFVVTDCSAIGDLISGYHQAKGAEEASALALRAGTDLECGSSFRSLPKALARGLLTEDVLDQALVRVFTARFRLGLFDPPEQVPFAQIPFAANDSPPHRELARKAALESLVLLENRGALPIAQEVKKIALLGPTADDSEVLLGNYHGTPSLQFTLAQGLSAASKARGIELRTAAGSGIDGGSEEQLREAVELAKWADLTVLALGITPRQEGEEGDQGGAQGDRSDISLPAPQQALFRRVSALHKPNVVVLSGGSAQALGEVANASALLLSWYSGEEGGNAIADVLFGGYNPAGRLPVTFYASTNDLPPFTDYSMAQRTYRYFSGQPAWGFGFGRSYTSFRYHDARLASAAATGGFLKLEVGVENTGKRAGDEVVQVYVTDVEANVPVPIRSLVGFRRVALQPGERKALTFELPERAWSIVLPNGERSLEPGRFQVAVGGQQPGKGNRYASAEQGLTLPFKLATGATEAPAAAPAGAR